MKKAQSPLYLRKYFTLISLVLLLLLLGCGVWGTALLHSQYTRELTQTGNITGAVLSAYPEAEDTLVSALQDTRHRYMDEGYRILQKYGYRQNPLMNGSPYYRSVLFGFLSLLALILFCSFTLIALCFLRLNRRQREQEEQLHSLLDQYLSENDSVLEAANSSQPIFSESFTDTLRKLGDKLMVKTKALNEERDHTKTLVTDISHQLKTPVSALKSCFTMCMEADTKEDRADFLQRCALQMNKLEYLVTSLVNISRLETSMISLQKEQFFLSDLLTDAVNIIYEKALQKNITLEIREGSKENISSVPLSVDKHWTAEAIANILDNAVKYSPAGSTVSLCINKFYSYVELTIADQGIGIPKAEYNQIFRRFYRGSHPVVKQSEGAGVGLYLSRRIIEEQNGTVTVKPSDGQGAVFTVHLPVQPLS